MDGFKHTIVRGDKMACPEAIVAAVSALAAAIARDRGDDELVLLSAIFVQLGDSLATILACRALGEPSEKDRNAGI